MESDFEIIDEPTDGRVKGNKAIVNLIPGNEEESIEFYVGVIQHEVLHVVLRKFGVPLEDQPEWLLDEITVLTDLWLDM